MADRDRKVLIEEFLGKVKAANKEFTKREAFKDLLNRLYASDAETARIIDAITMGSEKNIANIPRKERRHRGSVQNPIALIH